MRSFNFMTAVLVIASATLLSGTGYAQTNLPQPLVQPPAGYAPTTLTPYSAPAAHHAPIDSVGNGAIPTLPLDVENNNGVTYINGGIGDEEIAELKAKEKEFNVHVLINAKGGEFISDVQLNILDKNGTPLVSIKDAGPYVYAKLLPGPYTLDATDANGEHKKVKFTIKGAATIKSQLTFSESGGVTTLHQGTAKVD